MYTIPEDEGLIQLRLSNEAGEAVSSATLKCNPKAAILADTQHEVRDTLRIAERRWGMGGKPPARLFTRILRL